MPRAFERRERRLPTLLAAQDAQPHGRLRQVRRRHTTRHGDEADPRVLSGVGIVSETTALDRLVDTRIAAGRARDPSHRATSRARARSARSPGSGATARPHPSAAPPPPPHARRREREPRALPDVVVVDLRDGARDRLVSCAFTERRCIRFSFSEWLSGKRELERVDAGDPKPVAMALFKRSSRMLAGLPERRTAGTAGPVTRRRRLQPLRQPNRRRPPADARSRRDRSARPVASRRPRGCRPP